MADCGVENDPFQVFLGQETSAGEPLFAEPWHAQAFALTVALHKKGVFSWPEWTETFSSEIASFEQEGREDYFLCWLGALEKLVIRQNVAGEEELLSMAQEWKKAYLSTPHGHPVELS